MQKRWPMPTGKNVVILEGTDYRTKPHAMVDGIEKKHCCHCDQWLPLSSFFSNQCRIDGLSCHCADCSLELIKISRTKGEHR